MYSICRKVVNKYKIKSWVSFYLQLEFTTTYSPERMHCKRLVVLPLSSNCFGISLWRHKSVSYLHIWESYNDHTRTFKTTMTALRISSESKNTSNAGSFLHIWFPHIDRRSRVHKLLYTNSKELLARLVNIEMYGYLSKSFKLLSIKTKASDCKTPI